MNEGKGKNDYAVVARIDDPTTGVPMLAVVARIDDPTTGVPMLAVVARIDDPTTGVPMLAVVARIDDPTTGVPMLIDAGLGNDGSLAASELVASKVLPNQLKSDPSCSGKANFEAVVGTEIIGAKSGPPHVLRLQCWQKIQNNGGLNC